MILSLLFSHPALFLAWILAIIFGITIHEFSHAFAATLQGDRTPKYDGRLTLNPLAHLDFLGFIVLLVAGFGWGKPVVFNPNNIKYKKFGPSLISLAGPFSNFIAVIFFGFALKIILSNGLLGVENMLVIFLVALVQINLVLGLFNLIPIPPLDGSHLLFAVLKPSADNFKHTLERYGPMILLGLIILDNYAGFSVFSTLFDGISNFVFRIFGS
ncbi:MAG: site-2 protease family protein [Patescibacteria group bacterium]|jgi:Zn-dependent protease